jgi:hypothetical protein
LDIDFLFRVLHFVFRYSLKGFLLERTVMILIKASFA